ncbi:MAG: CopG family ribbon-helix-helix protein [Promethearchaeota archaeon]
MNDDKKKEENRISFRIKDFRIEELDTIVKERGFKNRSELINTAIHQFINGDEQLKENLKFFYDIFVKNASKFVMDINEIEKVEFIEGVLD